jgi:antitoxin HicB
VKLTPDSNGTILVAFPDVPAALMMYIEDRQPIQKPSPVRRQRSVRLPALSEAKVGLYEAMREAGVRKAELARRLNLHMPQIDRLPDLGHASRLDQIETALRALAPGWRHTGR